MCARHPHTKIFFATFLCDKNAPALLRGRCPSIKVARKTDYWMISALRKEGRAESPLQFGLFRNEKDTWTAFAVTETVAEENSVLRLLRSLSPSFSEAYLSSGDIRLLFEKIEETAEVTVLVNKAVAYSHRHEGQISFFKDEPYHAVFNDAENQGKFVDKVDFSITGNFVTRGFIGRNGVAKFVAGDTQFFLRSILIPVAQRASGKHEVFRNSSRAPGARDVSPIEIQFGEAIFANREDNLKFIFSLDKMARSGIAVMHQNPYVHVSLIDFFDGSSFDIFATSRKALTIIPQVEASPFSLNRLCNHIFENFREGSIVRPEEKMWTLEDVLT